MTAIRGVYAIKNTLDGSVYIGGAVHVKNRWQQHRCFLEQGTHHNTNLQAAWNQYGECAFEFILLEVVPIEKDMLEVEQQWIDHYLETPEVTIYNRQTRIHNPDGGRVYRVRTVPEGERWLTTAKVAGILRVNEDTIRKYLRSGALQGKRLGFRAGWRVSELQLREFMGQTTDNQSASHEPE